MVGGSIGRPVAGCRPRLLAFQRGSASGCSGTVSPIGNGRFRRDHSPVIDSSGALGAANHPFPSTAGSADSGPTGAKGGAVDHDAACSPAARAATGRDAVSIAGRATDNAAKPSNTAWPDAPAATAEAPSAPSPPPMPAEAAMSDTNRRQVQETLHRLGYYQGPVDGIFGPLTRAAIGRFQQDIGTRPTGSLTADEANRVVTSR